MSIVTPVPQSTIIKTYKQVDWDNSYSDIRLFTSDTERQAYLAQRTTGVWENCSVVKTKQAVRVQADFTDLITDNYMSFVNNGFDAPWTYYAFITSVNYINVNTVEIEYEIDWIQSFLFGFQYDACYVEREHVNDDTFGKNTVDERLEIGEYNVEYIRERNHGKSVIFTFLIDGSQQTEDYPTVVNGVVTAGKTVAYNLSAITSMVDILNSFSDTPERVISFCMGTEEMVAGTGEAQPFIDGFQVLRDHTVFEDHGVKYQPHNNKLLCYPYKFFTIDNYSGGVEQFRWEECELQIDVPMCNFQVIGTPVPYPSLQCYPLKYKSWENTGLASNAVQQFALNYTDFPMVAYGIDTFRAWQSQTSFQRGVMAAGTVVSTIAQIGAAVAAETPVGAGMMVAGAVQGVAGTMSNLQYEEQQHKIHSLQQQGSVGQCGINFNMGRVGFRETQYGIKPEYASKIDKYFDRYGYRVDTVKIPNIRGRQYCNYVKTQGAHISGNVPVDAKRILENAMDRGVTFWHTNSIGMELNVNPIV